MKRKLYLETFGCQMNVLDSQLVLSQLHAQGFESCDDRHIADVILYNTCSVREHAEQKVWSRLGELRDRKQSQPDLVIGVIGCMAERDGVNIFRKFPHVDILCGPGELEKLPAMVRNACIARVADPGPNQAHDHQQPQASGRYVALMGKAVRRSSTLETAKEDSLELLDLSRAISPGDDVVQSYVRITRGCNKFCTYCVVPYTRGPEVHRPPDNILQEVRRLADAGALEVTLLGQTINHYRFEHGDGRVTMFADLLYLLHESVPHLSRLRFVTSYPRDFTDEALTAMRDCPRICRYLHAPAQHGSNRILKLMNRGYAIEEYREFVDRARELMPDVSIASDFIVGFPTETDAEFEQTVEVVRYCRFKNSFIFKYSPRPGTVAIDRFDDDVPEETKRRRNNRLLDVQGEICAANNLEMVGREVELIVEGESKLVSRASAAADTKVQLGSGFARSASASSVQLVGRTRGDQVVCFEGPRSLKGKIVDVRIVDAQRLTLFGTLINSPVAI